MTTCTYVFEINEAAIDYHGGKYFQTQLIEFDKRGVFITHREFVANSNRIWVESDTRIAFYKNRLGYYDLSTTVIDLEEYFWVKLQAKPI